MRLTKTEIEIIKQQISKSLEKLENVKEPEKSQITDRLHEIMNIINEHEKNSCSDNGNEYLGIVDFNNIRGEK